MGILELARIAPVMIWGPPGVGKTASIVHEAKVKGLHLEVVIGSIRDPTDIFGIPIPDHERSRVNIAPPSWAMRIMEKGGGVVFFDELTTCAPAVQAAMLRVIHERVVGDLVLPEGTLMVAAGNPPEMAAGGHSLTPPLANRFVHIEYKVDPISWSESFPTYWGSPPDLPLDKEVWAQKRALVASFIRRRPDLLLSVPKEFSSAGMAWPSPRSWDFASRILAMGGKPRDVAMAVGKPAAMEFATFSSGFEIPEPQEAIRSWKPTGRGDVDFAVLQSVAAYAVSVGTEDVWRAAWKVLGRAAAAGELDLAAVAARSLADLHLSHRDWEIPEELDLFKELFK